MAEDEKREEATKRRTPLEKTADLARRLLAIPKDETNKEAYRKHRTRRKGRVAAS